MKASRIIRRNKDQMVIPEGYFFELYTPKVGRIYSPSLNAPLEYAKMCLSEDANVTFKDAAGNTVTSFALPKGERSFLVTEIHSVSAGSVAIIHDGVIDDGIADDSI